MPLIDRTKFGTLLQNLIPSVVALSKAMKDSLQVVHDTMDTNYNEFTAYKAGTLAIVDGGSFTDSVTDTAVDGGTFL